VIFYLNGLVRPLYILIEDFHEEAQDIIEGNSGDYEAEILILDTTAKKMRSKRIKEGSIEMGGIEVKFQLDPITKKPTVFISKNKRCE
jgi:ribonuclease R